MEINIFFRDTVWYIPALNEFYVTSIYECEGVKYKLYGSDRKQHWAICFGPL